MIPVDSVRNVMGLLVAHRIYLLVYIQLAENLGSVQEVCVIENPI